MSHGSIRAGRASYVRGGHVNTEDAGARAVANILSAMAETTEKYLGRWYLVFWILQAIIQFACNVLDWNNRNRRRFCYIYKI